MALIVAAALLSVAAIKGSSQVSEAPAAPPAPANVTTALQRSQQAQQAAEDAGVEISDKRTGFVTRLARLAGPGNGSSGTFIIPKDEADVKAMAQSEEDLNIMAHILDKVASNPDGKNHRAMGIVVRGPFEAESPRNLYVDGYGAIFFLSVNFPLSAPPSSAEKHSAKSETPSEWDQARQELHQSGAPDLPQMGLDYKTDQTGMGVTVEPYDADKVEQLRKAIIAELKNAAHIRSLKSHETVTVVVSGRSFGTAQKVAVFRGSGGGSGSVSGGGGGVGVVSGSGGGSFSGPVGGRVMVVENHGNRMVIRADKSDVEAFENNKLSLDEFQKKVTVLTY